MTFIWPNCLLRGNHCQAWKPCNSNLSNKPNQANLHKSDAAASHLSFLPPLLFTHDWNEKEKERDPLLHSAFPVPLPTLLDLRGKREEVTANTGSRQPYLEPSCVHGSHRRGGDRKHMDKSTQMHVLTYKRMHAPTNTHIHTVHAHCSLIFSSNHSLSATAAFTANCPSLHRSVCLRDMIYVSRPPI